MTKTMRILTFLLLMVVGTGQMWAQDEPEPEPVQFGTVMYNGTATNDGGTLKFFTSSKDAEQGKNEITVTNGQSAALTSVDLDPIYKDPENYDWTIIGYRFFIMATPAVGHRLPQPAADGTVSFIQAEVVTSAQQAPSRRNAPDPTIEVGQKLDVKFYKYYSGDGGSSDPATEYYGLYYVVMPADVNLSVSITADFPKVATTTVNYIDPTKTGDAQNCSVTAYVLDGTEARLGYGSYNNRTDHETWYVLNKDLTYTNGLELYGKVRLILADGATMTIGTDSEPIVGTALYVLGDLDIYGQSGQSGMLTATSSSDNAIHLSSDLAINGGVINAKANAQSGSYVGINSNHLTINGGTVTSTSTVNDGIYAGYLITINGGTVTATGAESGLSCSTGLSDNEQISGIGNTDGEIIINGGIVTATGTKRGIRAVGDLIINGGQVTATGGTGGADAKEAGLYSRNGNVILGWTNPTDYIKANSYCAINDQTSGMVVKTADGKVLQFTDGDNTMKLIGDITDLDAIKDQKLTPYGIGGYCGQNNDATTDVDESKSLTWDIALKDEPTSATDLATTLTIEGSGTMASYTTEAPAPWSDKTIEAANILASADVANVNAIAENIPVTLGYTDPVATTHTFNGYFVRKTADNTNISANVLSHNDQTDAWTLTMPDYAVNVSPKLTRNTTVSVEVANANGITAGDDAQVIVTANPVTVEGENNVPDVSGIATISVTEEGSDIHRYYNVAIVDGEGSYYVTNMANASYTISAAFNANDQWSASQAAAPVELNVSKIATSLDISFVDNKSSIYVGETATVSITLDKSINAVVTLGVDDKEVYNVTNPAYYNVTVALVNGKGTYDISGLAAGTYYIGVVYSGDDKIKESTSNVLTLTVSKRETGVSVSTNSPVIAK